MAVEFIPIDRDTPCIFPPSVQDYLPDVHLARFVVAEAIGLVKLGTEAKSGRLLGCVHQCR